MTHELEEKLLPHRRLQRRGASPRRWPTTATWRSVGRSGRPGSRPVQVMAYMEECRSTTHRATASAPRSTSPGSSTRWAPRSRRRHPRPALRGEIIICLGFRARVGLRRRRGQTQAVRDGDEWVINGQKMFTTNAHIGDYVFLWPAPTPTSRSTRASPRSSCRSSTRGRGAGGVHAVGRAHNITYYSDVRIPDAWRIGDVDGGWRVMTVSLQDEHSAGFGARILAVETPRPGPRRPSTKTAAVGSTTPRCDPAWGGPAPSTRCRCCCSGVAPGWSSKGSSPRPRAPCRSCTAPRRSSGWPRT